MSITITTPSQLDNIISNMRSFIKQEIVTDVDVYNAKIESDLISFSYYLSDRSFRSVALNGVLLLFKRRHGVVLPITSYYYLIADTKTPQQALVDWSATRTELIEQDPNRFVMDHLVYSLDFNTNLFYQFTIPSLTLVNIPLL